MSADYDYVNICNKRDKIRSATNPSFFSIHIGKFNVLYVIIIGCVLAFQAFWGFGIHTLYPFFVFVKFQKQVNVVFFINFRLCALFAVNPKHHIVVKILNVLAERLRKIYFDLGFNKSFIKTTIL